MRKETTDERSGERNDKERKEQMEEIRRKRKEEGKDEEIERSHLPDLSGIKGRRQNEKQNIISPVGAESRRDDQQRTVSHKNIYVK